MLQYAQLGLVLKMLRYFLEGAVRSELNRQSHITADSKQCTVPWDNCLNTNYRWVRTIGNFCSYIFQIYTRDRNWEFIGDIFLSVHNM
jgi:hypothetical protein